MRINTKIDWGMAVIKKLINSLGYLVMVGAFLGASPASAENVATSIENVFRGEDGILPVPNGSKELDASVLLPNLYSLRNFEPVWKSPNAVEELFSELEAGVEQGYRQADFGLERLQELHAAAQVGSDDDKAAFDIAATEAASTLIHHLIYGKVDPAALDADWNFAVPELKRDPAAVFNEFLVSEGFAALIERIDIDNAQYRLLVEALSQYKTIRDNGGWPSVADDVVLKPGMAEPAVASLRKRLAAEGAMTETPVLLATEDGVDPLWIYDNQLLEDVRGFQRRHGLDDDGVVGGRTFASLNQPVDDRINKLRLSLERGRWLMRDLDRDFVLVNIAGARTYFAKADGTLWTTRSITGSAYRKTPVFRDEIQYMEFNPTWTVPASIFRKDKLSRIRKDPGYLDRNNYFVRNTSSGSPVAASSVNWSSNNPGVTLVQKPGPSNALGLVKFMFPNKYAVYLHDTNDKNLFDRNERNLSSGCVRLEYPFEFASLLMEGDPEWSTAKMQTILDSGKTTRVDLPEPMPVLLTYWTAWVEEGEVHFREDPYGRDGPVLEALNR